MCTCKSKLWLKYFRDFRDNLFFVLTPQGISLHVKNYFLRTCIYHFHAEKCTLPYILYPSVSFGLDVDGRWISVHNEYFLHVSRSRKYICLTIYPGCFGCELWEFANRLIWISAVKNVITWYESFPPPSARFSRSQAVGSPANLSNIFFTLSALLRPLGSKSPVVWVKSLQSLPYQYLPILMSFNPSLSSGIQTLSSRAGFGGGTTD